MECLPEVNYYLYLTSVFMYEGRSSGRYIFLTYNVIEMQLAKVLGKCAQYVVQYIVDNLTRILSTG